MAYFIQYVSGGTSTMRKRIKEFEKMTQEEIKQWLYKNLTIDQITDLCVGLIQEELTTGIAPKPITITQEEFDQHFRIRKPQDNPARLKKRIDSPDEE